MKAAARKLRSTLMVMALLTTSGDAGSALAQRRRHTTNKEQAYVAGLQQRLQNENELSLSVIMITGERSRDSNSIATSLIVKRDTILYEQSYHGAHSGGRTPVRKEYKLTTADRSELTRILRTRNLLVKRTLSTLAEEGGPGRYFEVKIHSKLNGKEYSISMEGPRSSAKLKEDRIYRDSVYLIEQLYKIINKIDPDVSMPELIN